MLIVIPVLTSQNVDKSILPGVGKALEKFYLIHHMSEVLDRIAQMENAIPEIEDTLPKVLSSVSEQRTKGDFQIGNFETFGMEPTYISISYEEKKVIAGVKCVFFPLKSDDPFLKLLMADIATSKWINVQFVRISRNLIKLWDKVLDKVSIVKKLFGFGGGGSEALTGSVYDDVILERSSFEGNIITCFSSSDIEESGIEDKGGIPTRLFRLGWKSIVICDDVSSSASFCMMETNGICYKVPYSYLFAGTRDAYRVFTDLGELRQKSSPFFSRRKSIGRVFTECQTSELVMNYLNELRGENINGNLRHEGRQLK